MKFVIGGRKEGYSVSQAPLSNPKWPWSSSVWNNGIVLRHDSFKTAKEAINYCHDRYQGHRGRGGLVVHIKRR